MSRAINLSPPESEPIEGEVDRYRFYRPPGR